MANWVWIVTDSQTGQGVGNAEIQATVNTSPCPKVLGVTVNGCTSGDGYPVQGYTDSTGTFQSNIPYSCQQSVQFTVSASGYNTYPGSYKSGSIGGDVYFDVSLTKASVTAPPGQGLAATLGQSTEAGALTWGNISGSLTSELNTIGLYAAIALIAVAIIFVVIVVVV